MAGKWNYRSVVGMLNCLPNGTHPELAYAVHQCARFCNNPPRSHKISIKNILKYLLYVFTNDPRCQGLIYKPDHIKGVKVNVDASFASSWGSKGYDEPTSVIS